MAEREQSYKSHRRYFPWHHFVVQPLLFANFIAQTVRLVNDQSKWNVWQVVLAIALVIFSFTSRSMSLRAQDRVIRLEERMRLMQLMPGEQSVIDGLRPGQLIALRFASDAEAPALARRAAAGELQKGEAIKKEIQNWRPDYLRV
jgi:hypothetical protein